MPRGGKRPGAGRKPTKQTASQPAAPHLRTLTPTVPSSTTALDRLKPRQRLFVEEYLVDLNATAAYLRAGYRCKPASAEANAARLLGTDRVALAVSEAMAERSKRVHVDQDRVLSELARIAFADRRKLFERIAPGTALTGEQLYEMCRDKAWTHAFGMLSPSEQATWAAAAKVVNEQRAEGGFFLRSPDELDDDLGAVLEGVEVTTKSLGGGEVEYVKKVSTAGKIPALTLIGKHLGMWHEKGDPAKAGGAAVVNEKALDEELLDRMEQLLAKARGGAEARA